ncbi:AAA family ATPase, partial [Nonomuraea fuscirosea]
MDFEREILSPAAGGDELQIEAALRPKRLSEFIGQGRVREQLSLVLESAVRRESPPDHVLMSGAPGLGKTTLAMIIAAELNAPLRITSGPALERAGDLAAILSTLTEGEVLFIDEIHRMARPAEEMLYLAMEDFRVDIVVGKGPGATAIPLEIAPFTLVGATTRAGLLPAPLRDLVAGTGIAKSTFYVFFDSKEALYLELMLAQ